jgi:transposase
MLIVGCDIGKDVDVFALRLPAGTSSQKKKETLYRIFKVANTREAFESFAQKLQQYGTLEEVHVLLESTGHYGAALIQFLREKQVHLYRISPKKRYGTEKTDEHDAQSLCGLLYNQLVLEAVELEESWRIRPLIPATPAARKARGPVMHRLELVKGTTRLKNQLAALLNELFPEFGLVYTGTQDASALAMRLAYPTPQAIAEASLDDLYKVSPWSYPPREELARLQELARTTIGTKDPERQQALLLNQQLYIERLLLLQKQIGVLDKAIRIALQDSREFQILESFVGIGEVIAPELLVKIGAIDNFDNADQLRKFLGWSPKRSQTGSSMDSTKLNRKTDKTMRTAMYTVVRVAIQHDPRWRALYLRLLPIKTFRDPRTGKDVGKLKVFGSIAGRIIKIIFILLKRDAALVERYREEGREEELPPPELYDRLYMTKQHASASLPVQDQATPQAQEHTSKQSSY